MKEMSGHFEVLIEKPDVQNVEWRKEKKKEIDVSK